MPRPKDPNAKRDKVEIRLTKEKKEKFKKYVEENNTTMTKAFEEFIENLDKE